MDALKTVITSFVDLSDQEYDLIVPITQRIEVRKDTNLLERGQVCATCTL